MASTANLSNRLTVVQLSHPVSEEAAVWSASLWLSSNHAPYAVRGITCSVVVNNGSG